MLQCLSQEPADRPTAGQLLQRLREMNQASRRPSMPSLRHATSSQQGGLEGHTAIRRTAGTGTSE